MNKLLDLKRKGYVAFDWDCRDKTLFSSEGYAGTPAAAGRFQNTPRGTGYVDTGFSRLTFAESAAQRITDGYILVFCEVNGALPTGASYRLVSKRDAGGTNFEFLVESSTTLNVYNGTTVATSPASILGDGFKMVGAKIHSTSTAPTFYVNGINKGQSATSLAFSQNDAPIIVGNFYTGGTSCAPIFPITRVIILNNNTYVTDKDIAELYNEYMLERGSGDPKETNHSYPVPKVDDSTCKIHTNFATVGGYTVDLTGNANTGQVGRGSKSKSSIFGEVMSLSGQSSYINYGVMNSKASLSIGTNDYTIGGWFNAKTLNGYFFAAYNSTPAVFLSVSAVGALSSRYYDSGGVDVYATSGNVIRVNEWNHLAITGDRDGLLSIYLNGESAATVSIASGAANSLTTANQFLIGAAGSTASIISPLNFDCADFRLYNGKCLSATEIKNWYLEYAKKPVYDTQPELWLPTLANVTGGEISNTNFKVNSGTWKVSESTDKKKWIENVVAGVAYMQNTKAFGTYVFELIHENGSNSFVEFITDTIGAETTTGQDGYSFLVDTAEELAVREITNGTPANKFFSAVGTITPSTSYKYAIARDAVGVTTLYAKGGSQFPSWAVVTASSGTNPFTDITITTSRFMNIDLDAGDKFRLLGIHQGVLGLPELSSLY